jgi:hypothetical protein
MGQLVLVEIVASNKGLAAVAAFESVDEQLVKEGQRGDSRAFFRMCRSDVGSQSL